MLEKRIGPYTVGALIGRGGMGEVYRARDTRLERDVALKILPAELAADPERLARFEREAKVLASLQHQNIAAIFGVEQSAAGPVLVMELAEGQDLSQRLTSGPMPPDEVLQVAHQLARGLEFAHERGIIHRDLKPANVKVGQDGRVKILDFGLARALTSDGSASSGARAAFQPTVTQGLTGAGTVVGTAAYMSPEQARGYEVDRRADIWSYGVILFEMLCGRRLFAGETATDTLAAVLRKEPEWEELPADTPALLTQICRRCLEKDPRQRLRDIGEVRIALDGGGSAVLSLSSSHLAAALAPPPAARAPRWAVAAIAVLGLALGVVGFLGASGTLGRAPSPAPLVRSAILLPEGLQLGLNPSAPGPVQVSPDGKHLAFSAVDTLGQVSLYVRALDEPQVRAIPGTLGAAYPFWSADGRSAAFFSGDGNLRRLDLAGGPVVTVCAAENGKGGSWNQFDEILFAPTHITGIHIVPAAGGKPQAVTSLSQQGDARSHRFPQWLPDGKHFLYLAVKRGVGANEADAALRLGSKDGSVDRELMPCQAGALYSAGHILFVHDQVLMARPFDLGSLTFSGPPFAILEEILTMQAAHCAVYSAADAGVLAFAAGSSGADGGMGASLLQILDPTGKEGAVLGQPVTTFGVAYSPDGKFVVLALPDPQMGTFDLWIYEVGRDLKTRLTFDSESEYFPVWSPDGQWIYYAADNSGTTNIYRHRVTGAGRPEHVFESDDDCMPASVSPDGSLLAYTISDSTGDLGIGLCNLRGDPDPRVYRDSPRVEARPAFSPDGKWLAYFCTETGSPEIFVEGLDPDAGRYRVSAQGGALPMWSMRGDAVYYLTDLGELMSTEVAPQGDGLSFGRTARICAGVETGNAATFAVDPRTGNILVQKTAQYRLNNALSLITGWTNLLDRGKG